jgi:hypothetical protein
MLPASWPPVWTVGRSTAVGGLRGVPETCSSRCTTNLPEMLGWSVASQDRSSPRASRIQPQRKGPFRASRELNLILCPVVRATRREGLRRGARRARQDRLGPLGHRRRSDRCCPVRGGLGCALGGAARRGRVLHIRRKVGARSWPRVGHPQSSWRAARLWKAAQCCCATGSRTRIPQWPPVGKAAAWPDRIQTTSSLSVQAPQA